MESGKLQELIKKVFTDEKTRSEFANDPEQVMSRYSLSETEKKAVLSTHMKLGLVTAGSTLETEVDPLGLWSSPVP